MKVKKGLARLLDLRQGDWLLYELDEAIVTKKTQLPVKGWLRVSELGHPCERYLRFRFLGVRPEPMIVKPQLQRIFDNGTAMHKRYVQYCRRTERLVDHEKEVKRWPVVGHYDLCLEDPAGDLVIGELKSINSYGFGHLYSPDEKHVFQLNCYMALAGVTKGFVLYENKDNQDIKVFWHDFDAVLWQEAYQKALRIADSTVSVKAERGAYCSGCVYLNECLKADQT